MTNESSSLILPVLVSGVVGAGLALLLTPKSGREIRQGISRLTGMTPEQSLPGESAAPVREAAAAVQQTVEKPLAEAEEQAEYLAGGEASRSLLVPILVSGAIGAAIGLLFAPKRGSEVMEDIKGMASSAYEKSKDWYEQGATAVKGAMEKGKETAEEAKEKIRPAA
jgi:gas vesicle protein